MNHARVFAVMKAVALVTLLSTVVQARSQPAVTPNGAKDQGAEQHVAALKQSLADSQKRLRGYEWIETTIISLKGEEKGRKQQRCYYGADGKVQKVPIGDESNPAAQQQGGRRGARVKQRVVEKKKDEMRDYMERAAALVHNYIPPSAAQVQGAKDAGRMAIRPGAQGRVSLEFSDYLLAGDRLTVDIDAAANRLLGLDVATYLEKPEDKVTLNVVMGVLGDGTNFTARTTLDATAKSIRVVIENSGYRPVAR